MLVIRWQPLADIPLFSKFKFFEGRVHVLVPTPASSKKKLSKCSERGKSAQAL